MSAFCTITHRCFRRSLLNMDTWPILKFTLNLKSQKCRLYDQVISNLSFVHCQKRLNFLDGPNWNKSFKLFNLNKNNYLYHTRHLQCCNLTYSDNILCKVQDSHNFKVLYQSVKCHQVVLLYPHLFKNIFSRSYSNKKKVFNSKDSAIKRHEYIKVVLREKQRKMRQTQQHLKKRGRLLLNDIKETKSKMKEKMEEIIERENIWTFPNLLCVARIAVTPYLGYLIICEDYKLALVFVVFAGVTDMLDGFIARNFKSQSSKLGSFLDPMADKVLIATLFLTLTVSGNIPVPLTALIIARDVVLFGAGFYIRYQSLPPPRTLSRYFDMTHATAQLAPTTISKINTMIQLTTVLTTLTAVVFDYSEHPALHALWYLTAGSTIASALSYVTTKDTYRILKKKKSR